MNILKSSNKSLYACLILVTMVLVMHWYGSRILFGTLGTVWHIYNPEIVSFYDLNVKTPANWRVCRKTNKSIGFHMIPKEEKDQNTMIFIYKALQTQDVFYKEYMHDGFSNEKFQEVQYSKTAEISGKEAFGIRYINKSNNLIWEYWTIPSAGYTLRTSEIPERLYPEAWDFVKSNIYIK